MRSTQPCSSLLPQKERRRAPATLKDSPFLRSFPFAMRLVCASLHACPFAPNKRTGDENCVLRPRCQRGFHRPAPHATITVNLLAWSPAHFPQSCLARPARGVQLRKILHAQWNTSRSPRPTACSAWLQKSVHFAPQKIPLPKIAPNSRAARPDLCARPIPLRLVCRPFQSPWPFRIVHAGLIFSSVTTISFDSCKIPRWLPLRCHGILQLKSPASLAPGKNAVLWQFPKTVATTHP